MGSEAEEAANFYVSLIPNSKIENIVRPISDQPALVVEFLLAGTPYMTMAGNTSFRPDHSFSISILTDDQAETDFLWDSLLEGGGQPGQCGWIRDRFGLHWQIVPKALPKLMNIGNGAGERIQAALMTMSKINISDLESAARKPTR
jgi:predicted 3-demethylubiquinone-9 3-methyltransferase (glyoxalase superfamily)